MATYIISGILVLLFVLAMIKVLKDRKKSSCCCGCSGCPQKGICHSGEASFNDKKART